MVEQFVPIKILKKKILLILAREERIFWFRLEKVKKCQNMAFILCLPFFKTTPDSPPPFSVDTKIFGELNVKVFQYQPSGNLVALHITNLGIHFQDQIEPSNN